MAKNASTGNSRIGAIKNRVQTLNPRTKQWIKSSTESGKFLDVKADGKPFKGVRKRSAK